ncbi:hypothetical protein D3C72_1352070 [compost metagenome]
MLVTTELQARSVISEVLAALTHDHFQLAFGLTDTGKQTPRRGGLTQFNPDRVAPACQLG